MQNGIEEKPADQMEAADQQTACSPTAPSIFPSKESGLRDGETDDPCAAYLDTRGKVADVHRVVPARPQLTGGLSWKGV